MNKRIKAINARFWIWENDGWIKLTIKPGQTLSWQTGGRHDEGWFRQGVTWTYYANDVVHREWFDDGTDCDGRISHEGEDECLLENLDVWRGHDGTRIPDWEKIKSRQRDYAAEAMGY